jgi:hypothetical protein
MRVSVRAIEVSANEYAISGTIQYRKVPGFGCSGSSQVELSQNSFMVLSAGGHTFNSRDYGGLSWVGLPYDELSIGAIVTFPTLIRADDPADFGNSLALIGLLQVNGCGVSYPIASPVSQLPRGFASCTW